MWWLGLPFVWLHQRLLQHKQLICSVFHSQRSTLIAVFVFGFLNLASRVCFSTQWDTLGTHSLLPAAVTVL